MTPGVSPVQAGTEPFYPLATNTGAGVSYTWTPTTAGSYPYFCLIHLNNMKGTITVGENLAALHVVLISSE